ncbi:Vacuolar protein sorting-associated protein 16 homolog-like Protein [Tribolium castaneum]|uniref:Vacuolar protein sorting-associated protein 16 homolog n=1 Tax=Tribolium castaneum TaxID=7070 RepID=D7GXI5_TRICA|nr:PREDICTED: vacuolar protein sorting-associated protein 16 homolog [Tribolium castaneum]EFA13302.2 Vacuolar protein sorting-associated protein 16 homolog-like Protein [Tribolium castaneum]|eukprot:XP_008200104.1 PREDICTED: vacuolar protein sorting-associated protein 16 homolog [Tribolium castaneum]
MSAAMLTADWFLLGRDLYFRKFEIYTMGWHQDINLENFIASSAPYGGPIAIRRDEQKFIKVQGSGQPIISIFSGSGRQITSFKWTKRPIVCMGWSNDEKLICIQEDGVVVLHDMFGKYLHTFVISQKIQDVKIVDAKIFTSPQNRTGIAVMTSNFKIFLINNIQEPKTRQLSELIKSNLHPTSWVVISEDPHTEVLIAREKELFRLKQDEHHTSLMLEPDISNKYSSILEMAVSFNARHVALFTDSGYLWLGSSNLRTKYCEIDTNIIHKPKQLVWCGNESVVAYWERDNSLLIVGKHGQKMMYTYDSSVHLSPEIDGVRIISNTQHELLQKVPDVVQKIFRINSTDLGSFLLEASKHYQKRSHRANEYICLVKQDLAKAVDQCINAVGYEFDPEVQKMLIRAAQFGKCFIAYMNSDKYVNIIRLLRVLNAVRDPKIGIPLTFTQLQFLGQKVLLDRLITRKEYFLALQIAKYLKMPEEEGTSHILVHWAKYKVGQSHLEEETVAREIAEKLGNTPGISYSEIASTASQFGRKKLAIKLLDYESKASEQVKLLLELTENTPALVKAIESGDTDLVYMVILKLREKMALGDFKMTIRSFPVAQSLYIKYCKEHNTQALNEIYIQEDDFSAQAQTFIMESLDDKKSHMRDSLLTSAAEAYRKGRKDLNASLCDDYLKLSRFQRQLDEKSGQQKYTGKSVHETCLLLLKSNEVKLAEKFRNDYKIPDKRFWWLRIQSLAHLEDWTELEKFSKAKKSPIGYAPFVDICLEKNNRHEALKYLPRVGDDLKVKYYIKAECLEDAAKIAFEQKDIQSLLYVQTKCPSNSSLSEKVNSFIMQLDNRK